MAESAEEIRGERPGHEGEKNGYRRKRATEQKVPEARQESSGPDRAAFYYLDIRKILVFTYGVRRPFSWLGVSPTCQLWGSG